jgi:putative hydrolase of the HAD superfamily
MFPDAHKTLDQLKELGVKLALITNGAAEPQRAKVVRFALEHRFDHIQIEGEHGFGKPEERAYNHSMGALGVAPPETCCSSRAAWDASRAAALLWLFVATAASGQTAPGATYDPAAVVQAICRQYAAAQTGLPVDTMYAQCM